MEINHYGDTVLGGVAQEDIVEGRLVLLTTNVHSRNYGSQTDLPGVKLPDTTTEAGYVKYIAVFEQDNRGLPLYLPQPALGAHTMRYGWEQSANAPFAATVYLTHPGVQESQTIPSGAGVALFGEGVYTLPSGQFIYSPQLQVPGAPIAAADTASDGAGEAGKVHYSTTTVVGEVVRYDNTTNRLTFRLF